MIPIELRLWRSFVMLCDELNFRRAADRLSVSQPALTKQIKELEERLGVVLFRREPRGVLMTDAGQSIRADADALLEAAKALERKARAQDVAAAETVVLGALAYVARGLLPGAISRARQAAPSLKVTVQEMTLAASEAAAADGQIDLGLAMAPVKEPSLIAKPLITGNWVVVLPSDHPLAGGDTVPVTSLAGEQLILFDRRMGPGRYDALVAALDRSVPEYAIVYHAQDPAAGAQMATSGVGLFLAASYVLPPLTEELAARPVEGLNEPLTVNLVWRRERMRPGLRALIDGFLDTASA